MWTTVAQLSIQVSVRWLTSPEFMAATLSRDIYSMQNKLERAFKDFDRNESGTIEVDDIMSVLYGEQSMDLDRQAWVNLIKEVDKD